jgi:hypothetical protein
MAMKFDLLATVRIWAMMGLAALPGLAAPHLPASPAPAPSSASAPGSLRDASGLTAFCGQVQAVDLFNQTFVIRHDDASVETIPFSRWTDFLRVSTVAKAGKHTQAIDPTEVHAGDRLSIVLDANAATAERIEVLPAHAPR